MKKSRIWYRLSIEMRCSAPEREMVHELLTSRLFQHGCLGTELRENEIIAYFDAGKAAHSVARDVKALVKRINRAENSAIVVHCNISAVQEENWKESWQSFFSPVSVSKRLTIIQPWRDYHPHKDEIVITINPQQAFGTGLHESTRLILRLLEQHVRLKQRILDVGTGTGIAAIYAAKEGSCSVVGIDNDQDAVNSARMHVKINGVAKQVHIRKQDALRFRGEPFDLIMANIEWRLLKLILPALPRFLMKNGTLLLSGILYNERNDLRRMLRALGFCCGRLTREGEWAALPAWFDKQEAKK